MKEVIHTCGDPLATAHDISIEIVINGKRTQHPLN